MKRLSNRIIAFLLTIALVVPMVTTGVAPAHAESIPASVGKPKLHIDFLGHSEPDGGQMASNVTATIGSPADTDRSVATPGGFWGYYGPSGVATSDPTIFPTKRGTIFWVGVGIDTMTAFQLAKDGKGLYGVELGFYYNSEFVEPYTETSGASFASILSQYNLGGNSKNQWDPDLYHVAAAETDLDPASEPSTQEYAPPADASWKMVYASIQKQEGMEQVGTGVSATNPNRFNVTTSNDTQYILMIPFVLKKHDPDLKLCFKLARNAGIFSVGGGKYGYTIREVESDTSDYGAWERITRNIHHNLKQMLDFTGDLNIFTGEKEPDATYSAQLNLIDVDGTSNKATLRMAYDPFSQEVTETTIKDSPPVDVISGIYAGTTMELLLVCETNTSAQVTVSIPSVGTIPVTTIADDAHYTFVMPDADVVVTVDYNQQLDSAEYKATLTVENPDKDALNHSKLVVESDSTTDVNGWAPASDSIAKVGRNKTVTVLVDRNTDYDVDVTVKSPGGDSYAVTTVTYGEEYTFEMPSTDVEVIVTYTKAHEYSAMLAVDLLSGGLTTNAAKMSYVNGVGATVATAELNQAAGGTDTIMVRDGRTMTVDLKVDPYYNVVVTLQRETSGTSEPLAVSAAPTGSGYDFQATFTMPKENVQVKVDYVKASIVQVNLSLFGTGGESNNTATISATDAIGSHTATGHGTNITVIAGTEVTVDLSTADNYHVSSVQIVKKTLGGDLISYTGSFAGGTLKFYTPSGDGIADVDVKITYEVGAPEIRTATLVLVPESPSTGAWDDGGMAKFPDLKADVGSTITANIDVKPGWYISSITAFSATNSYTVSSSGSGYNGGAGDTVTLSMTMPNEDITVTVYLKENIPPEDPEDSVTLLIEDDDNDGTANNWGQLAINTGSYKPVGGQKKGDTATTISNPDVKPDDTVYVKVHADTGYRLALVDPVVIGPATAGVTPIWIDSETLKFTQPAGDITVTVHFEAGTLSADNAYTAKLHKVNDDQGTASLTNQRADSILSAAEMTTNVNDGTIKAFAGDKIKLESAANDGLFVIGAYVIDKDGAVVSLTPALPITTVDGYGKGAQDAEFAMPAGDVDVYVYYGSSMPPDGSYEAVLTVKGPDGEAEGVAGSAVLKYAYDGTTSVEAQSNGESKNLIAVAGSTMTVEIAPNSGYGIQVVSITPSGTATLVWMDASTVEFTMPTNAVGVIVKLTKGTSIQYTANLVVRLPAGVTTAEAGDARFENNTYSIVKTPGDDVPVTVKLKPGYYLEKVEVTPASLGVTPEFAGAFADEFVGFTMPSGNVTVNVYIKKGWPGMSDLPMNLKVTGPDGAAGNTAAVADLAADRAANIVGPLTVGQSGSTFAWDGDAMQLTVTAVTGYTWSLSLKDSAGNDVPYTWTGVNKVSFAMPATGATAVVDFAEGEDQQHKAELSDASKPVGELENLTTSASGDIVFGKRGETVEVTATPLSGKRLAQVLVTGASGTAVPLSMPVTGNNARFVMPDEDVTVELVFGNDDPDADGYAAILQLSGPTGAAGCKGDIMDDDSPAHSAVAGSCPGYASIDVINGRIVTVTLRPSTGYAVDHVEVTTSAADFTYVWDWNTVAFTMPAADVTVLVVFREATPEDTDGYTAQLVVDNSGDEANKAKIYKTGSYPSTGGNLLSNVKAGEEVKIDITVAAGSTISLISVTPTKYGVVVKPLTGAITESQTTSFIMPAGDVVVFVQFEGDAMTRYDVKMSVTYGASTPQAANKATLTTGIDGTLGPICYTDAPVSGRAANGETIVVDITGIAPNYYAVVTVKDSLGNAVAVTQTGTRFDFSMPDSSADVTVTFKDRTAEPPETRRAYLHIADAGADDSAKISLGSNPAISTNVDKSFISGDQGDTVDLEVVAGTGRHVKEAYVMYGNGVLKTVLPGDGRDGWPKTLNDDFTLQAEDVHVYVVFSGDAPPAEREYAAVLTVVGPDGEAVGAAGRATLSGGGKDTPEILSNATTTFTPVPSTEPDVTTSAAGTLQVPENELVTLTVTVEAGYEVDVIILTPLALGLTAAPITAAPTFDADGQYTFTMPAANVGVEVKLKEGDRDNIRKVILHIDDPSVTGENGGKVTFGHQVADADGESINVPIGSTVPVTVLPAAGYYVKYAYVLFDSEMIPLSKELSGLAGAATDSANFVMPGDSTDTPTDVYLVFAEGTPPATKEYVAVLTVTDPTPNGGLNKVTLSNGRTAATAPSDGKTAVTAPSDGKHYTLSALAGDKMTMVMTLLDGYTVKAITVTPSGRSIVPVQDPTDRNRYTFTMSAGDISILVELETGALNTYSATLKMVDESTAIGNKATMSDGKGHTVSAGNTLTGLEGTENLRITPDLKSMVKVAKVLYTTAEITGVVDNSTGSYVYPMTNPALPTSTTKDVTITVYLVDDPERDGEPTYFVMMKKVGRAGQPDNDAEVHNTSEPGMPSDDGWAAVHEGNNAEILVSMASGYYLKSISAAKNSDDSPVTLVKTGEGRYILTAPASDVTVTVEYDMEEPTMIPEGDIQLMVSGAASDPFNQAKLSIQPASAPSVSADYLSPMATLSSVPAGTLLRLETMHAPAYYIKRVLLRVPGRADVQLVLRNGVAEFYMPEAAASGATVVVEYATNPAAGPQSARPYDPENTDNSANGYQKGWLEAENLGNGKLTITVDSLTADNGATLKDTDDAAFTLYLWNGLEPVALVRGTDYELMTDPYAEGNYSTTEPSFKGSRFTIRSLIGGSPLSEVVARGGLLYISATEGSQPESELVEVVVPADTGRYTATLRIIDLSGLPGNSVEMSMDGQTTITTSGQSFTGLLGDETVRTTIVKLADGARLVSVTATETSGTTLLDVYPAGVDPQRYYWDMTGRDVIITVRIERDPGAPDGKLHQAAVVKVDDHELLLNDADVYNTSVTTLGRGEIWAYGYESNIMRVAVSTEPGYYAYVTAVNKTTNDPIPVLQSDYTVHVGGVTGTFDALFVMPDADVQITVTYSKDAPDNYSNKLTLVMTGADGAAGYETKPENNAAITLVGADPADDPLVKVFGDMAPTARVLSATTADDLNTGTALTLKVSAYTEATAANSYYVSEVTLTVLSASPAFSTTLTPDLNGEVSFVMPYGGEAVVTVTYARGQRMPQPHDPNNKDSTKGYTDGWIGGKIIGKGTDLLGNHQVEVTVPTLMELKPDAVDPTLMVESLSHAFAGSTADTTDIKFEIYYRDAYGNYHKLDQDDTTGDIKLSEIVKVTEDYDGTSYNGARFTMTCLRPGGPLKEIFKQGGVLYITAVDGKNVKGESRYTELVIPANHTATLHSTDDSGVAGNTATLSDGSQSVNNNGTLYGLHGDEELTTTIVTSVGARIVGVVASDRYGSLILTPGAASNEFLTTMQGEDVDVYVWIGSRDDPDPLYIAAVVRDDEDDLADNTAAVANTTDSTMAAGDIWTTTHEGDVVEVTVSTAMGYYAIVTARNVDTDTPVPVIQSVVTGDFAVQLTMPAGNVEITVKYTKEKPAPGQLTLKLMNDKGTAVIDEGGTTLLSVNNSTASTPSDGPKSVSVGTSLDLTAVAASGYYVKKAELVVIIAPGTELTTTLYLTGGKASFLMPLSNAEVRVYFEEGVQTGRPYDPTHTGSVDGYKDGWLEAENQGGTAVKIGVPTLFDGAILSDANGASFALYYKDALGNYQPLASHITISGGTSKVLYTGYTGWEFTATSKNTCAALDDILQNGGVLYITATKSGNGESEYTEVIIRPANEANYTATFKIVDLSTDAANNKYTLDDGRGNTRDSDGDTITGLQGGETMTTTVTQLGTNVKIQGVTMSTAEGGTVILYPDVGAGNIFSTAMPEADATFTLFLEDADLPDDKKVYIASVKIVDDTGIAGNTAKIVNADDATAGKGSIWTLGKLNEDIVVSFTTGTGPGGEIVYAVITAVKLTDPEEDMSILQLGVTGSGKGYFDMPAANVQVTVTFTTTPPDDAELTLKLAGHEGDPKNKASVYTIGAPGDAVDTTTATAILALAGTVDDPTTVPPTITDPLSDSKPVKPGTYLKILTEHGAKNTLKDITITVTTGTGYVLTLPVTAGEAEVQMPLNAATITVTFQPGIETGRPYDPENVPFGAHPPGSQDGWIEGENLGGGSAKITVRTLWQYDETSSGYKLADANKHDFTLYLYSDTLGTYVKLEDGVDYSVDPTTVVNGTYYTDLGDPADPSDDKSYEGTEFVIKEVAGGKLAGKLDKGITLYITATGKNEDPLPDGTLPWTESERTELIIPSGAVGLRPYDPDPARVGSAEYSPDHWIKADNRGDYLVITVPTLADGEDKLYSVTDEYSFEIFLAENDGSYTDISEVADQLHPDDETITPPYKLDVYYTDLGADNAVGGTGDAADTPYTGARFTLKLKDVTGMTPAQLALVDRLKAIMADGTAATEHLYIRSVKTTTDDEGGTVTEESSMVDLEVTPVYTLKGKLEAYGPQHEANFHFYQAIDLSGDLSDPANYSTSSAMDFTVVHDQGKRLWVLEFELKSSELPGTWMMVVTKPGHVEYRQTELVLDENTADTLNGTVFTFADTLELFGGDIDQDGAVTLLDREIMIAFASEDMEYTWAETSGDTGWEDSIYNPETLAYAADLDGDGMISMMDLSIIMHERNYNMAQEDYTPLSLVSAVSSGP